MPEPVKCPNCGSKDVVLRKTWKLEGGIRNNVFRIELYDCQDCKKTFRKAIPV
jgi:transposase-like protein